MKIFTLKKPEPAKVDEKEELLCDLDAILENTAVFILNGKKFRLETITTERFFEFVRQYELISRMKEPDEIRRAYMALVKSACPKVTEDDLSGMTKVQMWVLVRKIADKIMGRKWTPQEEAAILDAAEKKNTLNPSSQPLQQTS